MTRTAFRATLEISNHDPASPLTAVNAQVEIKDANGSLATDRFQIEPPTFANMDRATNGTIAAGTAATIRWLLIPKDDAAPATATDFFVGGQFSYVMGGEAHVPLEPIKITVYPDAALDLTYFHQRDVFSDDPFTPEIEPAQPYALVVMIKNRGAGAAKSLKITSGQPQIVENEKGLLIDFKLAGTSLDGTNMANALSLDFGRVEPGATRIAEWWFTSTLQGFFRDFNATFTHEDTLGDVHVSTIKSISIHEMTHIVNAGYAFADGRPDYLVNDVPDPDSLPDTLYLSDGTTNSVSPIQQGSFDGAPTAANPQVQLTATPPPGWVYLRVQDPSHGQMLLRGVRRSDGAVISVGTNVWVTDRTFPGPGLPAIRTSTLHLLDYRSTGSYTLFYDITTNALPVDTNAPTSAVAILPAQSPMYFPVTWSGQDDAAGSGLAYFDIFVSSNGGPYQVWLSQTTLRGAVFSGAQGSSYAFYSVATDVAGNREPGPGLADATTTVSIVNHAPVLTAIPDQIISEGETFSLKLPASDPDLPNDSLSFTLAPGAPPGMTLDSVNGVLQWPTGETTGPSTNLVTVTVRDTGVPPLTDSRTFAVIVNEVNTPPQLAPIANRIVSEGQWLRVTNSTTDNDIPAQELTYSLGPGAPQGMVIDPVSGLLTWRPSATQGGVTNWISVVVMDNGIPSLGATQAFKVIVRDAIASLVFAAIPTNVLAGNTGSMRLQLVANDAVTNLSMLIDLPESPLTNLTLRGVSGDVAGAALLRLGPSTYQAVLQAGASTPFGGDENLAELGFQALPGVVSTIVPVRLSGLSATRQDGTTVADARSIDGRVFVIGEQPILEALVTTNRGRGLMLYANPGRNYSLQYSTNLALANTWSLLTEVQMVQPWLEVTNVGPDAPAIFYRVYSGAMAKTLTFRNENGKLVIEWPAGAAGCFLEEYSDLTGVGTWTRSNASITQSNGTVQVIVPIGSGNRFYRLRCQ
jgi:hypothetical protein